METYCEIIFELEKELAKMKEVSDNITDQLEYSIGHCKVALVKLRERVISQGFPNRQSEIKFFKEIKPAAYSKLLFYHAVFDLESKRQRTDVPVSRRYLERKLSKIHEYMEEHNEIVQYYRCGFKHMDEQYFLRANSEIPLELKNSHQLLDEGFFTWHDHTFSMIMANEMLLDFIREKIEGLEWSRAGRSIGSRLCHQWSGKKIDLAELIYALHYAKMIDGGKISIRELAEIFGKLFGIEIDKDIYRFHAEIRQRKIDRTKFLDLMQSILQQRLYDDDE